VKRVPDGLLPDDGRLKSTDALLLPDDGLTVQVPVRVPPQICSPDRNGATASSTASAVYHTYWHLY
jgi:hypothetical protein